MLKSGTSSWAACCSSFRAIDPRISRRRHSPAAAPASNALVRRAWGAAGAKRRVACACTEVRPAPPRRCGRATAAALARACQRVHAQAHAETMAQTYVGYVPAHLLEVIAHKGLGAGIHLRIHVPGICVQREGPAMPRTREGVCISGHTSRWGINAPCYAVPRLYAKCRIKCSSGRTRERRAPAGERKGGAAAPQGGPGLDGCRHLGIDGHAVLCGSCSVSPAFLPPSLPSFIYIS